MASSILGLIVHRFRQRVMHHNNASIHFSRKITAVPHSHHLYRFCSLKAIEPYASLFLEMEKALSSVEVEVESVA